MWFRITIGFTLCNFSSLSEKICLQEDDQPKTFRPARPMRGRFQRLKPNVGKADERREILTSQEEIGANVEKNEIEFCVSSDSSQFFLST